MHDEVAGRQPLQDVARDDTAKSAGTPDANRAEELAIRDEHQPVRAAREASVEAAFDEGHGARRRRLGEPADRADLATGLGQEVGEAGRLVRREDDPGAIGRPALHRLRDLARPTGGELRLVPAEGVAHAQAAGSHCPRRFRFPGQLERPRAHQAALPWALLEVGRRPRLREVAGDGQLGTPFLGLAPEEVSCLGDVAGLVEDEQGVGRDVVQAGRRGEQACPDFGRVADIDGTRGHVPVVGAGRSTTAAVRRLEGGETLQVRGEALSQPGSAAAPEALPDRRRALAREEKLAGGEQGDGIERADGPLVRRVEASKRVDFVAEELDPDGKRAARREHVDEPPATGELAATGHFQHRHVAEVEELGEKPLRPDAGTRAEDGGLLGKVGRLDRVLQQGLHGRHEHPCPARAPRGECCDPGGGLVGDQLAALIGEGGPRLEDRHRLGVAEPCRELLGDAIADLGVPRNPAEPLADGIGGKSRGEVGLRAVGHVGEAGVAAGGFGLFARAQSLAKGPERATAVEERREGFQVGQPPAGSALAARPGLRGRRSRRRGRCAPRVLDLGIHLGDVEVRTAVALVARPGETARVGLLIDPRVEPSLRSALASSECARGRHSVASAGRTRRQPVFVRRMPSSSGGPSMAPGGATRSSSAGRSSKGLNRLAALFVPSRAQASTASAAASSSSSSRRRSDGWNLLRTWSTLFRPGSPIPTRSRLNFSEPSSPMIDRRPLWPPAPPPSRNRSFPKGRAKSSVTTSISLSGARSRRAPSEPRGRSRS